MASEKSQIRERAMAVTIASLNQMRDFDVETLPRVWDLGRGPHRQRRTHEGTATPCSEDDRCKNKEGLRGFVWVSPDGKTV